MEISVPDWVTSFQLQHYPDNTWDCLVRYREYGGVEVNISRRHLTPKEAAEEALQKFDFETEYWRRKRGEV